MIVHRGCVLLVRRATEPLKGEWSVPGGMLELGEKLRDGIRREILEETGLKVEPGDVLDVFDSIFRDERGTYAVPLRFNRLSVPLCLWRSQGRKRRQRGQMGARTRVGGDEAAGFDRTGRAQRLPDNLAKYQLTPCRSCGDHSSFRRDSECRAFLLAAVAVPLFFFMVISAQAQYTTNPLEQAPAAKPANQVPPPKPPDMVCFGEGPKWSIQFVSWGARYLGINQPDQDYPWRILLGTGPKGLGVAAEE